MRMSQADHQTDRRTDGLVGAVHWRCLQQTPPVQQQLSFSLRALRLLVLPYFNLKNDNMPLPAYNFLYHTQYTNAAKKQHNFYTVSFVNRHTITKWQPIGAFKCISNGRNSLVNLFFYFKLLDQIHLRFFAK